MAIIGIDLGTTNSLAVCWKNGKKIMIKNSLGDIYTPSAVSIDEKGEVTAWFDFIVKDFGFELFVYKKIAKFRNTL